MIYEYQCEKCNEIEEFFVKNLETFPEPPLHFSDICNAEPMKRIISKTTFQLKGSGWYKDGYSKNSNGNLQQTTSELKSTLESSKKELREKAKKI